MPLSPVFECLQAKRIIAERGKRTVNEAFTSVAELKIVRCTKKILDPADNDTYVALHKRRVFAFNVIESNI